MKSKNSNLFITAIVKKCKVRFTKCSCKRDFCYNVTFLSSRCPPHQASRSQSCQAVRRQFGRIKMPCFRYYSSFDIF